MAFEGPHPDPGGVLRARPAARAGRSELLGRRGKNHSSNARPPAWGTHLERDHYDIVWAAYNDRTTLINAVRRQGIQNTTSSPSKRSSCPSWHERSISRHSLSSS